MKIKLLIYQIYKLVVFFSNFFYSLYLRLLFKHIGKKTIIVYKITFRNPINIEICDNCKINHGVTLKAEPKPENRIYIGNSTKISPYATIGTYTGFVNIGENCGIGHKVYIGGHGGIIIGNFTMIGGHSYIIASDHNYSDINLPYIQQGEIGKGIKIGNNVWIGANCVILDNITIGDNAIIGAGSVVKHNIPANVIAFGNPAKIYRHLHK